MDPSTASPLILALDTSSPLGSVALFREGRILKSTAFSADPSHSQKLLPAIDALFSETGLTARDVERFAVVIGPGSFTGLRVSLASVRGLAGNTPCFGGLATEVAAWAARGKGQTVLAMTDLFHGEVFASLYDAFGHPTSEPESGQVEKVLAALREQVVDSLTAVGSASIKHRDQISALFADASFLDLPEGLAPHLASLASVRGVERMSHARDLLPFYLRDPLTRGLLNTQPKVR